MKKLIFWFLKKYTKDEKGRLEVFNLLHEQVENTYTEQTTFGNVYNANIEFIMANKFVQKLVKEDDAKSLAMIEGGLKTSYKEALDFLRNDKHVLNFSYDTTKN